VSRRIVCLLPVRNGARMLPTWLDEAPRFADAVVALDDGSTDETRTLLESHPVVARVLTNRPRQGFLGWHDGLNRNRLLAAAAELSPEWIFSLDVDERLDPTDAEALRRFVDTGAFAACAYGFHLYRMLDGETYDPAFDAAYRLFRFQPGQRFPQHRLGCIPVPLDVPAWMETTLRIKHYGDVGDTGREARGAKLREADPDGDFRHRYKSPPLSPGPHPTWAPRDAASAILPHHDDPADLEGPILSVAVVAAPGRGPEAAAALSQLRALAVSVPTEFLTVTGNDGDAVADRALRAAQGDYVLVLPLPAEIDTTVLDAVVDAHERGHAFVRGTPVNVTATAAGEAGALLAGQSEYVSFAREPLLARGGLHEGTARHLLQQGFTAATVPELRVSRQPTTAAAFLRDRFQVGRRRGRSEQRKTSVTEVGRQVAADARAAWSGLGVVPRSEGGHKAITGLLIGAGAGATWLGALRERLSSGRMAGRQPPTPPR
jgi:hypothetical protein